MKSKKGEMTQATIAAIIIAIIVLILTLILYFDFKDKGVGFIDTIKNLFRFGK